MLSRLTDKVTLSQHETVNGSQRINGQVGSEKEQASIDNFVYLEIGSNRLKA